MNPSTNKILRMNCYQISDKIVNVFIVLRRTASSKTTSTSKKSSSNQQKNQNGVRVKQFNWENKRLFGPLLRTKATKQTSSSNTVDTSSSNAVENDYYNRSTTTMTSGRQQQPTLFSATGFPLITKDYDGGNPGNLREIAKSILTPLPTRMDAEDRGRSSFSVTSILQQTMSEEAAAVLERWRQKMIAELGSVGFSNYQKDLFSTGSLFHKCIQHYLASNSIPSDAESNPKVSGYWKSVFPILKDMTDVVFVEHRVKHPLLGYHGVVDCVAKYKDKPLLLEWKTSQKQKPSLRDTYDNPLQLVAYLGAINAENNMELDRGAVVIAYSSGEPAHFHSMSPTLCQQSWEQWLTRLHSFWKFKAEEAMLTEHGG